MQVTTVKALTLMGVALPTMFAVIGVFIAATKILHKAFPAPAEDDDDDEEDEDEDED